MTVTRKSRLYILLTVLIVACTIIGILPSGPARLSVGALLAPQQRCDEISRLPFYDDIAELISQQHSDKALALIAKAKARCTDSIDYYNYETLAAKVFFDTMQPDSMLSCNNRISRFLSRQTDTLSERFRELRMTERMQWGVYYVKMRGRMDSALHCYKQALELAWQLPCADNRRMMLLGNLADAYKQTGQFDKSVGYYQQALSLGDTIGMDSATLINMDIGIASAYAAMANFEQSAVWWEKLQQLRPQMQLSDLFQFLNNRGNDYYLQGRYEESLSCFMQLDSLVSCHPEMVWEKMFGRANMSDIYLKLGQPDEAVPLLEQTEAFFAAQHMPIPLYYLTTQRISLALLQHNTPLASRIARENDTPEWMIPEQKLLRQKVLLDLMRQQGDWKRYAEILTSTNNLQDSIISDKTRMQYSVELMRHDHERMMLDKQHQVEELHLSLRWATALLVAALIVIVLITVIGAQKLHVRRMKEQAMLGRIASLRMETVRNRITPHFMGNALSTEMLAQMDGRQADLDSLVELLHRGIEMTGSEQTTLSEELKFIEFYCNVESRSIGPDFSLRTQLAADVDANRVVLPSMFLQILVENALKHGLKPKPQQEGRQRAVLIRATRKNTGTLVEVIDNGVGMPEERRQSDRTGLKVVKQTILLLNEQNRRQMEFGLHNHHHPDGDTGCCAWLLLPDDYHYTLQT